LEGPTSGRSAIADYSGLASRSPLVAGSLAILMLGLAGIPLTSGFVGKFVVFQTAANAGYLALVILALLGSVAGLFFYLRIIVVMYFQEPAVAVGPGAATATPDPDRLSGGALAASVALTIAFGIVPWPLLNLVTDALPF
ncbi:MAG: NADH-quinone oxidoreductase subunit N, partial [Acidimicrobiia bacterium]|nr:NADH-quinone oxidoreductase subunit N [Acidimicrobiia bacterium]